MPRTTTTPPPRPPQRRSWIRPALLAIAVSVLVAAWQSAQWEDAERVGMSPLWQQVQQLLAIARPGAQHLWELHLVPWTGAVASLLFSTTTPSPSLSQVMPSTPTTDPFLDREVLPTNVRPRHYALHLWPDLKSFQFRGELTVQLDVHGDTRRILCNANELEVQSAELVIAGTTYASTSITLLAKEEQVAFEFGTVPEGLTASAAELRVKFTGLHNDKMSGFYRSQYVDEATKETKFLVVTQFEPTDARKAFPCWDEPAIKATFDVELTVDAHLTALSNMDVVAEERSTATATNQKTLRFARTPIMSTYLVAFVVGELEHIETTTKDKHETLVRVFTIKGQVYQGEFALGVAARTLEFFAQYFDMAYPLPKMDLVAIPDFAAGAMENWGLVTYRTVYLLFDEKVSAAKSKQGIAYVVAHELAHQWFGNIVTFEWWSDLWLNEGFATWVGWLAVDHLFPAWNIWTQFVNEDLQRGLGLDALRSSHPIEVPVKSPSEINQIFDAISYSKGASVIRMLVNYMTEPVFQKGVRAYLKKFQYSNAKTADLWEALSAAADGKPIGKLMHSWTREMGYPVLTVRESTTADGKIAVRVKQERFLASGDVTPADDKVMWFVPLQMITSKALTVPSSDVLDIKEKVFELPGLVGATVSASDFYKLNYGHTGFYRTNYDDTVYLKLAAAVKDGKLGTSDRIGILTDLFALSRAGYTSVVNGLRLVEAYSAEDDYIVWNEIAMQLNGLRSIWWEQPAAVTDSIKLFQRRMFSPLAAKLGWSFDDKKESFLTGQLRTLAIASAGKAGDPSVINEAQSRFKSFLAGDKQVIHPNLRGAVFSIVLREGGVEAYEAVLRLYQETTIADQKLIALSALGSTRDPALLQRTLDFSMSEGVRPQDIIYVFGTVASNPKGRTMAWEFVQKHWAALEERYYKGSMSLLGRIVSSTTDSFSSTAWFEQVKAFFAAKDLPAISRSIQQSLEKISTNAKYVARDSDAVAKWAASVQ